MLRSAALALFLCGAAFACRQTISNTISPAQVGTKYARLTGYFATRGVGDHHLEDVPGSIRHDAIRDEVTLASVTPTEVCFDAVLRTAADDDEPFDQLSPRCEVDGKDGRVVADDELISVMDYHYTGQVDVLTATAVTPDAFAHLGLSQPADQVFRVIERKGRLCCGLTGRNIELAFINERMTRFGNAHHLVLEWSLH
jgi:hypothetical protein